MNIVIRADASYELGSGHVRRCLTLAGELQKKGAEIRFISREEPGNLIQFIENLGWKVFRLREGISDWKSEVDPIHRFLKELKPSVDWLIVDHYELDINWEKEIRPFVKNIMVIDDLADRKHECDLLLDQNYFQNNVQRYDQLVPSYCKKVLGPQFALLRPEFLEEREKIRERDGKVRHILIFFGGSDPTNETEKTLHGIQILNQADLYFDLVVGGSCRNKEKIIKASRFISNVTFHEQVSNMASLMAKADLSLGAGGTSTWERCYLALPSFVIVVAKNQERIAMALEDAGAIWNLGWHKGVDAEKIAESFALAIKSPEKVLEIGKRGNEIMGGKNFMGTRFLANEIVEGNYASA
jgi:UDP-2,4-diacetamido-2,4,6-trideoxy-beta-L-altropyranose hydrolase